MHKMRILGIVFVSSIVWIIDTNVNACTYGGSADCVFPCNCEEPSERCDEDSGLCAESGCKDGPPTGFTWSGPGCRVGNVAYDKNTTSLTVYEQYYPSLAVDGDTTPDVKSGRSCFHSAKISATVYWMVDLGAPHVIYNVTLFNRLSSSFYQRLQDFTVYVSNSSNVTEHKQVCKHHTGWIDAGGNLSLECEAPTVARYISVINGKKEQYFNFAICEFVAIGAKATNCSLCGPGGCDPLNGCDTCPQGKRKPNCVKDCVAGTYGRNCSQHCHCRSGSCDVVNGQCEPAVCMDWWLPPTCSKYIVRPNMTGNMLSVASATSYSVEIEFEQLSLDEIPAEYYHYVLQYNVTDTTGTFEKELPHSSGIDAKSVTIEGLAPDTSYTMQVIPIREDTYNSRTDAGVPTMEIQFTTGSEDSTPIIAGLVIGILLIVGGIIAAVFVFRLIRSSKEKKPLLTALPSLHSVNSSRGVDSPAMELEEEKEVVKSAKPTVGVKPKPEAHGIKKDPKIPVVDTTEYESLYENQTLFSVPPVPVGDLASYIEGQKQQKKPFDREFQNVPTKELFTRKRAALSANHKKNRFTNIKPYDKNRVILEKVDGDEFSDYINASYIDGYNGRKKVYVASQGPRPNTVPDMWRMIWELNTNRIVMLTRETENGKKKCERYWPEQGGKSTRYGLVRVRLVNVEEFADFNVSRLKVSRQNVERTIYHFHFTSWPDKRPPEYAFPLLTFHRKVKSYDEKAVGPLVVHCSAGVGRTGTFIALDHLLQQADVEKVVDVFGFVNEMRTQRSSMVQTRDQYVFVYEALLEALTQGQTIIAAAKFSDTYRTWSQTAEESTESELARQYAKLETFRPTYKKGDDRVALQKDNIQKNRDVKLVAGESRRPLLKTAVQGRTDYINAVFVNSYRHEAALVATHMPLPDTAIDLWRLVLEHHCDAIIMLNHYDHNDQTMGRYWPESSEEGMMFGPMRVDMTAQNDVHAAVSTRDLQLTGPDGSSRKVRQFYVKDSAWPPEDSVPGSAALLCVLLEQLEKWQQQQTGQAKVLVHCMDGVSRTGVFCACVHIIEKLRVEQEVDIYTAVKHVKTSREQFIGSMEQYKFLHQAVEHYIGQFETYANFA